MSTNTLTFKPVDRELWLIYTPEQVDVQSLRQKLFDEKKITIKKVFHFNKQDLITLTDHNESEESIVFRLATEQDKAWLIQGCIFCTEFNLLIDRSIFLDAKFFIAYRDISIIKKLSEVVKQDIRLVSDEHYQQLTAHGEETEGVIPLNVFKALIARFPNTSELTHYTSKRISTIVQDFFPRASLAMEAYERYFANRKSKLASQQTITSEVIWQGEYEKYQYLHQELTELLKKNAFSELEWQSKIQAFILFLFPKYISVLDELVFKDGFVVESQAATRRTDLLLLDADGHVDLIELKHPDKPLLRKTQYRQNYVPSGELSGSIMQLEKYLFSLASDTKTQQNIIKNSKQFQLLNISLNVKIVNPKGMLIIGRDAELDTDDKKQDFELIKRKYANIMDILTYDDLLNRLKIIVSIMKLKEKNSNEHNK